MSIAPIVMEDLVVMVPLAGIVADDASQTRVQLRPAVVRDYAEAMSRQRAEGRLSFPPVTLFREGATFWLGDGFHRVAAARQAGLTEVAAVVRPGTRRDALLCGLSANNTHGLQRTNRDKRKAVEILLADPEWSQWSDREIARRCQVSNFFVGKMRRGASVIESQMRERKVERNGAVYEMKAAPTGTAAEAALKNFRKAYELMDRLADVLDAIAQEPAAEHYRLALTACDHQGKVKFACAGLQTCREKLRAAQIHCCVTNPPAK